MKKYLLGMLIGALISMLSIGFYANAETKVITPGRYTWFYEPDLPSGPNIKATHEGAITILQAGNYTVSKPGLVIEFYQEPTAEEINAIDLQLSAKGLTREGGITLADKIDSLQQQINALAVTPK